jgi:hypothetical protein
MNAAGVFLSPSEMGEIPSPFDEKVKMVGATGFKESRVPGVKGKKERTRRPF